MNDPAPQSFSPDDPAGWAALAELYHRYLTGLLLATVLRVSPAAATEVSFRTFRRQHLEAFLPGLQKLGLTELPHAVACAQYHVLSNALGGVRVVWIPESDTKSWVRYLPPRWIFDGTAVCGIPTEVSRAMLHGWHGHNGVTLGNDRLGFVCTRLTTDAQPGLEGYYIEEDRPLAPDERVRFSPGEKPEGEPVPLPLPSWDPQRLAKVERNYSSMYVHTILPVLCSVVGVADASSVGRTAGRQIGMQYGDILAMLGEDPDRPAPVRPALRPAAGRPATDRGHRPRRRRVVDRAARLRWKLFEGREPIRLVRGLEQRAVGGMAAGGRRDAAVGRCPHDLGDQRSSGGCARVTGVKGRGCEAAGNALGGPGGAARVGWDGGARGVHRGLPRRRGRPHRSRSTRASHHRRQQLPVSSAPHSPACRGAVPWADSK
ncbi:MAG: hypothetical protein R2749_30985 [Acidimicrobiales bacterium]